MPHPWRLLRLSLALVVAAASILIVAANGTSGSALAGPLGQLVPLPCSPTSTLFVANLVGSQEVPPVPTTAVGTAIMQLQPNGSTLTVQITTAGLDLTQITASHIHSPAPPGVNAPVRVDFFLGPVGTFTSPFNVTVTVPPDVLNDMRTGNAYVNVHSVQNPGGVIRGQIGCLNPTPTPVNTLVPTVTPVLPVVLTVPQAIARVVVSGQPGIPAASQIGQTVQVTGQVNGTGTVTGSMTWALTATVPAGVAAGSVPVAVISTTLGLQGFPCAAVAVGATTVACNGTTTGNALLGSTVTVVFPNGASVTGTVTSAQPNAPRLPPPPPIILPPPPPPVIPMPPMMPPTSMTGAAGAASQMAPASAPAPAPPPPPPTATPVPPPPTPTVRPTVVPPATPAPAPTPSAALPTAPASDGSLMAEPPAPTEPGPAAVPETPPETSQGGEPALQITIEE